MSASICSRRLAGGGGLSLRLLEVGNAKGAAILFLHGFSQSAWIWRRQLENGLATDYHLAALDLRGHGASDKPLDGSAYSDSKLWADDVAAAVSALGNRKVVLVAWSYGGLVACDYLRHYGADRIAGLVLAGALTKLGNESAMAMLGPRVLTHVPGLFAGDVATAVATLGAFIRDCNAAQLEDREFHELLGYNCAVPPEVRAALFSRNLDNDILLASLRIPTLAMHGSADAILLPQASRHVESLVPGSRAVILEGAGHTLFRDAEQAFERELRNFALQATARRSATVRPS
jgi:non-heme chloroperoxidase